MQAGTARNGCAGGRYKTTMNSRGHTDDAWMVSRPGISTMQRSSATITDTLPLAAASMASAPVPVSEIDGAMPSVVSKNALDCRFAYSLHSFWPSAHRTSNACQYIQESRLTGTPHPHPHHHHQATYGTSLQRGDDNKESLKKKHETRAPANSRAPKCPTKRTKTMRESGTLHTEICGGTHAKLAKMLGKYANGDAAEWPTLRRKLKQKTKRDLPMLATQMFGATSRSIVPSARSGKPTDFSVRELPLFRQ
jgi:hypothetical protein